MKRKMPSDRAPSLDTHEHLDKKALQYLYRKVAILCINNSKDNYGEYSNGKDCALCL
jgi:hypothetical protein